MEDADTTNTKQNTQLDILHISEQIYNGFNTEKK